MITLEVMVTGFYREVVGKSKLILELETSGKKTVDVHIALEQLCKNYGTPFKNLLYSDDGQLDSWTRVMINGQDIRFFYDEEPIMVDGDHLLIMSVSAGG